jgi:membrane-associated protease RseP (regulator of RpoE activity)
MPPPATVTVYARAGDPSCEALLAHLRQRGIPHTTRDVLADPGASAELFGRLGRVAVPVVEAGGRMLVGYDPVQLARFLPTEEPQEPGVSFGAAVRSVSAEVARERGLPWRHGVEVGRVADGSPAAQAGVRPGDLITAIGAYTLDGGADQFRQAVATRRPGDSMTMTLWRDGESLTTTVTFPAPAPPDGDSGR